MKIIETSYETFNQTSVLSALRFPTLVAASVSEWFTVHSLTLAATKTQPKKSFGLFAARLP